MKNFLLILILLSFNLGIVAQESFLTIKKKVQLSVVVENINLSSMIQNTSIDLYLDYVDKIPIKVIDSLSFKNILFFKVGFPILKKIDDEKLKMTFDSSVINEVDEFGVEYWNCCFNGYVVYDMKENKLYKIYGFINSDLKCLINNLKEDGRIKNEKEFLQRTSNDNLKEIKFKFIIENIENIYKYSVYRDITVIDAKLKNGKDVTIIK